LSCYASCEVMAMPDDDQTVLTVPQVAERLNVKPETVRRMLRRGDLPGWLIGGRAGYRVFQKHVDELLERRPKEQHP
jgi:excisionase family DNA binding protein